MVLRIDQAVHPRGNVYRHTWTLPQRPPNERWLCCPAEACVHSRLPSVWHQPSAHHHSYSPALPVNPGVCVEKKKSKYRQWGVKIIIDDHPYLDDDVRWNAVSEELIETTTNFKQPAKIILQLAWVWWLHPPLGRLLFHNEVCCLPQKAFPVTLWHRLINGKWIPTPSTSLLIWHCVCPLGCELAGWAYCWTRQASQRRRAFRKFLLDFSAIVLASSGGRERHSFLQTCCSTAHTWRGEREKERERERERENILLCYL